MSLTEEQIQTVDAQLAQVREKVTAAAEAVMRENNEPLDIPKLGSILQEYARTKPIPVTQSAWAQIISVPGIVWISAILALTFGILSIYYQGLADIAKVFAGAIVGASGATVKR